MRCLRLTLQTDASAPSGVSSARLRHVHASRYPGDPIRTASIEHLLAERFDVRHLTLHFETPAMAERHHHRFLHQHDQEASEHHDCPGHH